MAASGATSNADEFDGFLAELEGLLDLDVGGFGEDLATIAADGIVERTTGRQKATDGSDLAPNRGRYGVRKRAQGVPIGTGLEESSPRMLYPAEVRGEVAVTPRRATMSLGTGEFARKKARWFEDGRKPRKKGKASGAAPPQGSGGQPPRPFYGLDDEIQARLEDRADRQLDERLRRLAGG